MPDLPLFPLNTVLFPGMPISLRIFEERYRQMLDDCLAGGAVFGVVCIRRGQEARGPLAAPYLVGCTAHTTEVRPLPDGRIHLAAFGQQRFEILELQARRPYLTGAVRFFARERAEPDRLPGLDARLRPWVIRYMRNLARVTNTDFDPGSLPADPAMLSSLAATLLQTPLAQKQALLEIPEQADLLEELRTIYRREVALLETMLAREDPSGDAPRRGRPPGPKSPSPN